MDVYTQFPTIPNGLLLALEERFPQKDFDTSYEHREIDYHCGARSVIRFLKKIYEEQNENILTNNHP
jgi:hypothetical protein